MKTIVVGVLTRVDAERELARCAIELQRKGIEIRRVLRVLCEIRTNNCNILFREMNSDRVWRGLLCDASFGITEGAQCLVNRSHAPTNYNGTFLDYVCEVEGMKE